VMEFFGEFLTALVVNCFKPRPPRPHVQRVRIDDLVLCRESWRFAAADVPVRSSGGDDARCRDLRSWAEDQGIPQLFFVKTAAEPKPMYVDLRAPLLVDNLVRVIRRARAGGDARASQVEFTEMLPGPKELWLTDAAGRRYTSEFRMVAVDAQETMPVVRAQEKGDAGPVASP
jgi:Lantibiotic dehydratase, N terminus